MVNTHAPSAVFVFLAFLCGHAKMIRKSYLWTQIFVKMQKKSCVFKRKRIHVDEALMYNIDFSCNHRNDGPNCPVDNEHLSESQVSNQVIKNSIMPSNYFYHL